MIHHVYLECDSFCPSPRGSTLIVRIHLVCCCVWCLPSAGLWCCSQGWQRVWLLYSFIWWPHSLCSGSCVSQSFPGVPKCLLSSSLCSYGTFQFLAVALQSFFARWSVSLLPSAQATPSYYPLCLCLMGAWNNCLFPLHSVSYSNTGLCLCSLCSDG